MEETEIPELQETLESLLTPVLAEDRPARIAAGIHVKALMGNAGFVWYSRLYNLQATPKGEAAVRAQWDSLEADKDLISAEIRIATLKALARKMRGDTLSEALPDVGTCTIEEIVSQYVLKGSYKRHVVSPDRSRLEVVAFDPTGDALNGKKGKRCLQYLQRLDGKYSLSRHEKQAAMVCTYLFPGAETVYFTEGLWKAEALHRLGLSAVSMWGGISADLDAVNWGFLHGLNVRILPDEDDGGRTYALHARDVIDTVKPKTLHVITIPLLANIPEVGRDVGNWLDVLRAEGLSDAAIAERLTAYCEDDSHRSTATTVDPNNPALAFLSPPEENMANQVGMLPWLVPGFLARGQVTMLAGASGTGKSRLVCKFIADMGRGMNPLSEEALIDQQTGAVGEALKSYYISYEMGNDSFHRCMMNEYGEWYRKVAAICPLPEVKINLSLLGGKKSSLLKLMEEVLASYRGKGRKTPDIFVLDPWTSFIAGLKNNSVEDIRPAVDALETFARLHNVAVLVMHHFNKRGPEQSANDAMMGSGALIQEPRLVWYTAKYKNSSRFHLTPVKVSDMKPPPGLIYEIVNKPLEGQDWSKVNITDRDACNDADTVLRDAAGISKKSQEIEARAESILDDLPADFTKAEIVDLMNEGTAVGRKFKVRNDRKFDAIWGRIVRQSEECGWRGKAQVWRLRETKSMREE